MALRWFRVFIPVKLGFSSMLQRSLLSQHAIDFGRRCGTKYPLH